MKTLDVVFRVLLSLLLVSGGLPIARAQSDTQFFEHAVTELEDYQHLLQTTASFLDRSQTDLEELLGTLEFDSQKIISYVKQDVKFQQYPGLLRGPMGTFVSSSGNALDQSVLLAKLLKDAGYDARVMEGVLNTKQAERLLGNLTATTASVPLSGDANKIVQAVRQFSEQRNFDSSQLIEALSQKSIQDSVLKRYTSQMEGQKQFIVDKMRSAGITISNDRLHDQLLQEAQNYHWVQYKEGPASPWQDIHPALGSDGFSNVDLERTFSDQIPEELQHRFAIEVIAVQDSLGKLEEKVIVPRWERPAANFIGGQVTFNLHSKHLAAQAPLGRRLTSPEDWNDVLIPMLNGQPVGRAVDLNGNVIDLDAASSQFAGVFETVSQKGVAATTAVAGLGSTGGHEVKRAMSLKSIRMNYILVAPGGHESRHTRYLFDSENLDLSDPEVRDEHFRNLTRMLSINVLLGRYNLTYLFSQSIGTLLNNIEHLRFALEISRSGGSYDSSGSTAPKSPMRWLGSSIMPEVFDAMPVKESNALYRATPTVFVRSESLAIGQEVSENFDIINSVRRSVDLGTKSGDYIETVQAGIWDTITEGVYVGDETYTRRNTVSVFDAANSHNFQTKVLTKSDVEALESLGFSDFAKRQIRRDLEDGFVVVVPENSPFPESGTISWWRIHSESGETLGMVSEGYQHGGIELTEKVIFLLVVTVAGLMIASFFQWHACQEDPDNPSAEDWCKGCSLALGVMGAGVGVAGIMKNPMPAIVGGAAGGFLSAVCAIAAFLDYEAPGLAPDINGGG